MIGNTKSHIIGIVNGIQTYRFFVTINLYEKEDKQKVIPIERNRCH